MSTAYIRHPDLRLTAVDGEGVVLHLGSRQYFSVNETGVTVLEQLRTRRTVADLVQAVTTEYEVTAEEAERTVRAFLERCLEAKLVTEAR
jgi:hypothetical protein